MITQGKINRLLRERKYIQDNIIWQSLQSNETFQKFRVEVLGSEQDLYIFHGNFSIRKNEVISLALVYNGQPLIRIDKKHHCNPPETDGLEFFDWHKHEYDEILGDDVARDVTDEFNSEMLPGEFVSTFMEENHMRFLSRKSYQKLLFEDQF